MTSYTKAGILIVILALFASVGLIQHYTVTQSQLTGPEIDPGPALPGVPGDLPRLVNLKTENCIHCKRMVPVLAELKQDYGEAFRIYTFDIGVHPDIGRAYGTIRILPTLVFFDREGREVLRYEGYMSKADILYRFESLGLTG